MKQNNIEITLSLLYCNLIFVIVLTVIINYNDFNNQFYLIDIQAEPSNDNNENEEDDDKEKEKRKR